jgi:dTMP kinase
MPKLITFEGIDGCGKTSVVKLIQTFLKNADFTTYLSYEPGNKFGEMAKFGSNNLEIKDTVYLWWLSRRFEQNLFLSKPEIQFVLKDRYYDSTYVYQDLKNTDLEEHNFNENYFMKPHLTVFLDVDPKTSIDRVSGRFKEKDDLYETEQLEILEKRRNSFKEIIEKQSSWRSFQVIDTTSRTIDEVAAMAYNYILRLIDCHIQFTDLGSYNVK